MPSPARRCSGSAVPLEEIGLITLDAHFDMRDLDRGPQQRQSGAALIDDGLPGANIAQVGLASFANSRAMHEDAVAAGNSSSRRRRARDGIAPRSTARSTMSAHCDALVIDCDIDVIDRAQIPAAPGARPGGMAVARFLRTRCAAWRPTRACG